MADARGSAYNPWEHLVGQIFLGSELFCESMQALIDSMPRSRAHPKIQRRLVLSSFDAILAATEVVFGETRDSIRARSHRPVRKAVAQLGWEEAGLTLRAIGEWIGLSEQAVSHLIKRGRHLEKTNDDYSSRLRQIRLRLGVDRAPF